MAIPAGISTALVHLDAPVSFIGDAGQLHVTLRSSVPLIWEATGTPLANFIDSINPGEGAELAVQLPHTDQDGFLDGNGNSFKGWSYIVEITYEKNGEQVHMPAREFQVLTGQDSVDLAQIPAGDSYVPVVAPILQVTSVGGKTGAVSLADLGLDKIDNTRDVDKPITAPTQAALDAEAQARVAGLAAKEPVITPNTIAKYYRGDKTWATLDKTAVGLPAVDNTADADKPVSTATAAALAGKSNTGHTHSFSELTGKVSTAQLPPLAINETFPVASQAEMLALVAERGDMAIRSDNGRTYVLSADTPSVLSAWKEIMAAGQVQSVAGKTGVVTLVKGDVGLGSVDNTADAAKPVSAAQQAALDTKAPTANPTFTGTVAGVTKAHVGLGNVDNTADSAKPVSTPQQAALDKLPKGLLQVVTNAVNTSAVSGVSVMKTIPSFTFKAGRKYRVVWDSDVLPNTGNVAAAFTIGLAPTADSPASTAVSQNIGLRNVQSPVGNVSQSLYVTGYYEPTVDTTWQIKFLAQTDGTGGTILVQGNRPGAPSQYRIYDDGAQF